MMTNLETAQYKAKRLNEDTGDLDKEDGYNCEHCKNKGAIYYVDLTTEQEVQTDCPKCSHIRAMLKRRKNSGLGTKLTENTFENFKDAQEYQKKIKSLAIDFCKDDAASWFYIGGQPGCGKTHICTAIIAQYLRKYKGEYMLWVDVSKELKSLSNDINYQDKINHYKNIDVLYIDDFLKTINNEQPSNADVKLAFEIINSRLQNPKKITIISSERHLDSLVAIDEGLASRIIEQAGDYILSIANDKEKNYRLTSQRKSGCGMI